MPKQPKLNYDAEYQLDIPAASEISMQAPESIEYKESEMDYIPGPGRMDSKYLPASNPRPVKHEPKPDPKLDPEYADYVPRAVTENREKQYRIKLRKVAKDIWDDSKPARQRYELARKLVETATQKDLKNPTPELIDAKRIVDAGPPLTTKQAVERARSVLASQAPDKNIQ